MLFIAAGLQKRFIDDKPRHHIVKTIIGLLLTNQGKSRDVLKSLEIKRLNNLRTKCLVVET